ncbi:MAG: OmpA family protein [Methyloceanibacter sp.]|nr:OmpA family protein [Methyloceanibacter sp.]
MVSAFLAGCETVIPDVTGAPAAGFENLRAGSEEDFILNVGRRTYFASGSAEIDQTARLTLDKQAEWLNANTRWKIKLQGHADDPGSEDENVALSARRAEAVMAYLVSKGVDRNRMWSKGYGRERLVRDCEDITCKSQNRRVVSNLRDEFDAAAR